MAPKRRNWKNRDLVDNLKYTVRPDGRKYYQYLHPVNGRCFGLGYDRAQAIEDAKQANALLQPSNRVQRIVGRATTLQEYIAHYLGKVLPQRRVKGKPLSEHYMAETTRILARIQDGLGKDRPIADIRQAEIATYLNRIESADAANQHRVRLIQLWRQAISDETITHGQNFPERIIPRDTEKRKRQRLTLEQYQAIYQHARPAIQHAMELSLNSLQRRGDIHKWRFDDQREGHAHVIQSKTRKHGVSAWLRIPLDLPAVFSAAGDKTLGQIIERCRDNVLCPFLVHEQPQKLRRVASKGHQFQLTASAISRGFAEARDASGLFTDMEAGEPPTFHELISLGQHLREEAGWSLEQIQRLRGHTTTKMTEHYLEGHAWSTVEIPRA